MSYDGNVFAALMGVLAVVGVILLIWLVINIVSLWRIFTKADEAGWKSIIPIYNSYVQYSITWNTKMFWVNIGLSIVSMIVSVIQNGNSSMILTLISTIISIASTVIFIIASHKLSKAFGHGVGFTVGLVLLNPIFMLILAFGSSEYEGIPD